MDKFFDPINIRGGVNFPALPTTYGDDLSYLETVSRLCRMVNDLIEQCNLNTEDKMKLENECELYINEIQEGNKTTREILDDIIKWTNAHKDILSITDKINNLYLTKATHQELLPINEKITDLYTTKAKQRDLDIAIARLNSLSNMEQGSTTGDAELIDGRVMTDGDKADNIGEAIRTQINQKDKKINGFTEVTTDFLMQYKKLSGEYYDRTNHNVSNYATSYVFELDYYDGCFVRVTTSVPRGVNYATFLSDNNEVISFKRNVSDGNKNYVDSLVSIPTGAKYLVVGGLYNNNPRLAVKGEASKLKNIMKELKG